MDIILTTSCNKKCEGCCYLFNKYKTGEHLDADKIINNIKKLQPVIESYEKTVSIIGGETFLYPDLVKIVNFVKTLNIEQCVIFTNGTIIPDYFEELCKAVNYKFHFVIGNYGNPEVIDFLKKNFTKNEISCVVRPDDDPWVEHGDFINHDEPKVEFCKFRYLTLMKDRVYACGRFAQAVNLGLIPIENLEENEYVDLDDEQLFEKIDTMMKESYDTFSKTCNYCLRGSVKSMIIPQGK